MVCAVCSAARLSTPTPPEPLPHLHASANQLPRKLTLSSGTIQLRRPRVLNSEERFESRLLPLFTRRTRKVADLIPELYLHGISEGDLTLRCVDCSETARRYRRARLPS